MSLVEKPDDVAAATEEESSHHEDGGIPTLDRKDLFPEGGAKAYTVLAGSFCGLMAALSFLNSSAVLQNYLKENILRHEAESTIGWIFSVNSFLEFSSCLIIGPFFDKVGARIPLVTGFCLLTVGYLCASWCSETWQFILSYSILGGIGCGFTFCASISVLSHWFLVRRGQAIGFAYMGGALGGALFPVMYKYLLPRVGFGWTIRVGTLICSSLACAAVLLIQDRRSVFASQEGSSDSMFTQVVKKIDLKGFKDAKYAFLVLGFLTQVCPFIITLTYLSSYGVYAGMNQPRSYYLIVTLNATSMPGRLLVGYFADIYGRFNALCCVGIACTILLCVVWLPTPIGHTEAGLFTFAGLYGFCSGSLLSIAPACIGQISMTKDFAKRSGTAFFVLSFGDLVGIPIAGAIGGSRKNGYDYLVVFVAVLSVVGTLSSMASRLVYGGFKWSRL